MLLNIQFTSEFTAKKTYFVVLSWLCTLDRSHWETVCYSDITCDIACVTPVNKQNELPQKCNYLENSHSNRRISTFTSYKNVAKLSTIEIMYDWKWGFLSQHEDRKALRSYRFCVTCYQRASLTTASHCSFKPISSIPQLNVHSEAVVLWYEWSCDFEKTSLSHNSLDSCFDYRPFVTVECSSRFGEFNLLKLKCV